MRKKQHPLSGALYEELGDGLVRVTKQGTSGVFRWDGGWVEGDLTYADPHLLIWVGGRSLPPAGAQGTRPEREIVRD